MRLNSLLSQLLGLEGTRILGCKFDESGLVVSVAPRWRRPRCSGCQRRCGSYARAKGRRWRHLDVAGMKLQLEYDPRRVRCPKCGVRVELVPWAEHGSWFTRDFEDQVGYLAQRSEQSTVQRLMRVAWSTVGDIVRRVVARHGDPALLDGLTHIGVDELSYRKHHKYVTVVVDHLRGRVVWAAEGKNAETLKRFFDELGAERTKRLEAVTIDMSAAYIKAVTEASPQAQSIFDRFHVQRLAHDALDRVRREEAAAAKTPTGRKDIKGLRWLLQKRQWNLQNIDRERLSALPRANRRLYRAYLLKESLAAILDGRQVHVARKKLQEWLAWAYRSRLRPFRRLADTIKTHLDGILAYVRSRLSNARTEALNGKARTITRRTFGLHSASAFIALLKLCCSGIHLNPVFRTPETTH